MYCEKCITAFKTEIDDGHGELAHLDITHHISFQSLLVSAQLGCVICDKLLRILPAGDYSEDPGEPVPCTEFRKLRYKSLEYTHVIFSPDWLVNHFPEPDQLRNFRIVYASVAAKVEDLLQEAGLRAGTKTWETCWDKQSVIKLFGASTGSDQSWKLIQHWITRCNRNHKICKGVTDASWFPTRLIHIGEETKDLRLYVPDVASWKRDERYTTLSHCWGSDFSQVTKLMTSNLGTLQQKIQVDGLLQTFKDAIHITKRLGLRFLWIDSLCIIQDDDEDWAREAAKMSMVYTNTYLNISATSARNDHQGCYRSRDPLKVAGLSVARNLPDSDRASWFKIVDPGIWTENVDQAPLNQRGWVLQERLLSPRVLHFSTDQVLWECRESYACETFPKSFPQEFRGKGYDEGVYLRDFVPRKSFSSYKHPEAAETELWSEIVETYSRAHLTFRKDKLIALSGIAREVGHLLKSEYVAGLWQCHLPYSLLWAAQPGGYRSTDYLAPSWSWASVDGPISFAHYMEENFKILDRRWECATLLNISIDLATSADPFGQVKNGWIQVRGKLGVASWGDKHNKENTPVVLTNFVRLSQSYIDLDSPQEFHIVPSSGTFTKQVRIYLDDAQGVPCQQAFFMPIYKRSTVLGQDSAEGLLLQQLPSAEYVRIGKLVFEDGRREEILASFPEREIVII